MSNIINDPITIISPPAVGNADLPAAPFPTIPRIQRTDAVGPEATNPQPASLERRTETLRAKLNQIIAFCNALDQVFLRKDGTAAKDGFLGMIGDLYLGDTVTQHYIKNLRAGAISISSLDGVNGAQLYAVLQALNSVAVALTTAGYSITHDGAGHLQLVNDVVSPGSDMFYGTNSSGIKGWRPLVVTPNHVQVFGFNGADFPGATQSFVVPANTYYMWALVEGAWGRNGNGGSGGSSAGSGGAGAAGGRIAVKLRVTPGEIFDIVVGGMGNGGYYNAGDEWPCSGSAGGGLSRVLRRTSNAVAIGGGGGGGAGGAGGGYGGGAGGAGGEAGHEAFGAFGGEVAYPWTVAYTQNRYYSTATRHNSIVDAATQGAGGIGHGGWAGHGGSGSPGGVRCDADYTVLSGTDSTFASNPPSANYGQVVIRWFTP